MPPRRKSKVAARTSNGLAPFQLSLRSSSCDPASETAIPVGARGSHAQSLSKWPDSLLAATASLSRTNWQDHLNYNNSGTADSDDFAHTWSAPRNGRTACRWQIWSAWSAALEQNRMQPSSIRGTIMHPLRATIVSILAVVSPAVVADPLSPQPPTAPGAAESVHVQPRGSAFAPNSAEDDAVQKRITRFNAEQTLQDATFNRRLSICRRC